MAWWKFWESPPADRVDGYVPTEPPRNDPWKAPAVIDALAKRVDSVPAERMDAEQDAFDSYRNELTGIGDFLRDKTYGNKRNGPDFEVTLLSQYDYSLRWRGSDLGGRIVETIPDEMTREGWDISIQPGEEDREDAFPPQAQPGMVPPPEPKPEPPLPELDDESAEQVEGLEGQLEKLGTVDALWKALCYERAYGGGAILVGADDGLPLDQPLDETRINSVTFLNAFTGGYDGEVVAWSFYNDPSKPKHGMPEMYMLRNLSVPNQMAPVPGAATISRQGLPTLITWVHESRLLVFSGTAPSQRDRVQLRGWGDSVFTRVDRVLSQYDQTWGGVANLMTDFSQAVLKIDGLTEMMGANNKGAAGKLSARARALNLSRSVSNILLIGEKEEFKRDMATLGGIDGLLQQFALRLAAAADMPVSLLMGQAPAGLNATGASDIRFFYDRTASRQRKRLLPQLQRLIRILMLAKDGPTNGAEPSRWNVKFRSLYQLTEMEKADLRLKTAQADQVDINTGVLNPGEVTVSRYGGSEYSTDTIVDLEGRRELHEQEQKDRVARAELEQAKIGIAAPPFEEDQEEPAGESPFDHGDGWNEEDHPREEDGKFGSGGGGTAGKASEGAKARLQSSFHEPGKWGKASGTAGKLGDKPTPKPEPAKIVKPARTAKSRAAKAAPTTKPEPKPAEPAKESSAPGKSFADTRQADAWGKEHYAKWSNGLPSEQLEAARDYTSGAFQRMNGALRGTEKNVAGHYKQKIDHLEKALRSAPPVPETVVAYRGVDRRSEKLLKQVAALKPGDAFVDKAFLSTSLNQSEAKEFSAGVMFKITVPKGTKGAAYMTHSKVQGEGELLLSKGRAMSVTRVEKVGDTHVVHLTVSQLKE